MEQLAERLSQEEIMCDEGVEEDDEEIKKLESEKVMNKNIFILQLIFIFKISIYFLSRKI